MATETEQFVVAHLDGRFLTPTGEFSASESEARVFTGFAAARNTSDGLAAGLVAATEVLEWRDGALGDIVYST